MEIVHLLAKHELKVNLNNKSLSFCSESKYLVGVTLDSRSCIADTLRDFAKSWHHASHSW